MATPVSVHQTESYTCDLCEDTVLCSPSELVGVQWKWRRYAAGKLLLCPDCQPKAASGKAA